MPLYQWFASLEIGSNVIRSIMQLPGRQRVFPLTCGLLYPLTCGWSVSFKLPWKRINHFQFCNKGGSRYFLQEFEASRRTTEGGDRLPRLSRESLQPQVSCKILFLPCSSMIDCPHHIAAPPLSLPCKYLQGSQPYRVGHMQLWTLLFSKT